MFNLLELKNNGKEYNFRLTYRAKIALEKREKELLSKMNDPEIIVATKYLSKMNDESLTDEERANCISKSMPLLSKIDSLDEDISSVDLGFLLLQNDDLYTGISREEFEDLYISVEKEKGFEETLNMFNGMKDKVFTVLEKMKNSKQKVVKEEKILN